MPHHLRPLRHPHLTHRLSNNSKQIDKEGSSSVPHNITTYPCFSSLLDKDIREEISQAERANRKRMQKRREKAILSQVWYILPTEKAILSHHFLLRTTLSFFSEEVFQDTDDLLRDKIVAGEILYNVNYLNTTAELLIEAQELLGLVEYEDIELLLSFRAIKEDNFAVCIVQPRKAHTGMRDNDGKYYALTELRSSNNDY